jgi:hypothetical protein
MGTLVDVTENGRKGGKARAKTLTKARRKEIAALGGKAKAAKKARRKRD